MARTWLSIRVDLVEGGGHDSIWPRPGRIFAAARSHTFAALAEAIDDTFARWDRAHLHEFELTTAPASAAPTGQTATSTTNSRSKTGAASPSDASAPASSSSTPSTSATTGPTCAPSDRPVSTLSINSASDPINPCLTGAGAPSPTNTAADSTVTMAKLDLPPTHASPTYPHCARGGENTAAVAINPTGLTQSATEPEKSTGTDDTADTALN
jgi:hypothetical protein